jgi:hypothetical protein
LLKNSSTILRFKEESKTAASSSAPKSGRQVVIILTVSQGCILAVTFTVVIAPSLPVRRSQRMQDVELELRIVVAKLDASVWLLR